MEETNHDDFWKVDYKKLPEKIEKEIIQNGQPDIIEEQSTISFDGKMLTARIPKKIAQALDIQRGDHLSFRAILYPPISEKENELEIKLGKR